MTFHYSIKNRDLAIFNRLTIEPVYGLQSWGKNYHIEQALPRMEIKETIFPNLPQRLIGLGELAENLWWSWHPAARMLFKMLDRQAWKENGHNPDKMLKELPREILESAANDPEYLNHYHVVLAQFREDIGAKESCLGENLAGKRAALSPTFPQSMGYTIPCPSMRAD